MVKSFECVYEHIFYLIIDCDVSGNGFYCNFRNSSVIAAEEFTASRSACIIYFIVKAATV